MIWSDGGDSCNGLLQKFRVVNAFRNPPKAGLSGRLKVDGPTQPKPNLGSPIGPNLDRSVGLYITKFHRTVLCGPYTFTVKASLLWAVHFRPDEKY